MKKKLAVLMALSLLSVSIPVASANASVLRYEYDHSVSRQASTSHQIPQVTDGFIRAEFNSRSMYGGYYRPIFTIPTRGPAGMIFR